MCGLALRSSHLLLFISYFCLEKGSMQGMPSNKKTCISLILIIFIFVSSKNFTFKTFTGFNLLPWMILHFENFSLICSMLMYDGIGTMTFKQEKGSFENVHGNLDFGR
jgi:hypothetical protein